MWVVFFYYCYLIRKNNYYSLRFQMLCQIEFLLASALFLLFVMPFFVYGWLPYVHFAFYVGLGSSNR
jgi:hypothetical protein